MVETVFSVSLIAVVIMMIFNLFPASSLMVHRARQEMQASTLAQTRLEQVREQPFRSLQPGLYALDPVTVDGVVYRPTREVYRVPAQDPARLLGIRMTVRWSDREMPHELSQEVFLARFPR